MPYRRNYRRRPYRRRRQIVPKSRAQIYGNAFKQLGSDIYKLKQMVNVEYKFVDFELSTQTVNNSSGVVLDCTVIPQGDGASQRDGRVIRFKSMESDIIVTQNTSATSTVLRMLIVLDVKNDSTPTIGDVISGTSAGDFIGPRNLDNRNRFVIYKDKTFALSSTGTTVISPKTLYKQIDVKSTYSGSVSTSIEDNGFYVMFISNEGTNLPSIEYKMRLRFIDN